MKLQKSDFLEIDFTAKFKDSGEIFDSSLPKELKKLSEHAVAKPFTFSLGNDMFLPGISDFLIGKEISKFPADFKIELTPDKAFGPRNAGEVKMIPMKIFKEHNIQPIPGVSLNFDGRIAKILSVSGGRVLVDFNNPLAGKDVVYQINVLRKVDDVNEKIKALNEFLFKKDFLFTIKDKKVVIEVEKEMKTLVEMFKDKFKEILGMDLQVNEKVVNVKKHEKNQENTEKQDNSVKDSKKSQ